MADVSLDDYILEKNFNTGMNRGFNGPVQGQVVINNPGVRGRGRGGRVRITGPGGQGRGQVELRGRGQPQGRGHFNQGRGQHFGQVSGQHIGPDRGVPRGRGMPRGRGLPRGRGMPPGRGQSGGPGRGRPFQKQAISFGNNNGQEQQVGLTTNKFAGGLVTKKHIQSVQNQPPSSVTVTGVGNYQTFDARQKLALKQDARAKLMEKTKFSDARARIQNSRIKKETQGGRIKLTNNKMSNPVTFGGMMPAGGNGVYGVPPHMYGGPSAEHMYGGPSAEHMYGGPSADQMYGGTGDAGVQLSTAGGLTITKPSNVPSASNVFKPVPTYHVPAGYEDLFEDEPMSLGSECNATMDFERGPVIKVKNEHFTKPKPTPITFNSDPKPVSQYNSNRNNGNSEFSDRPALRMTTSQVVPQRQPDRQPLRLTTSQYASHRELDQPRLRLMTSQHVAEREPDRQPLRLTTSQYASSRELDRAPLRLTTSQHVVQREPDRQPLRLTTSHHVPPRQPERQPLRLTTSQQVNPRQPEPPLNLSRKFSARKAIEDEEEMILNAPTPILPKSRPAPTPPPEPVKFFGGPPLVLSRSRPKSSQTGPGISGIVVPPSLRANRPVAHTQSAGAAPVREKLTLSARSPAFSDRVGEVSTADSGESRRPPSPTGSQVLVTNLHSIVTQDDIIELFGALGPMMKVKLIKPGTAEVVYVRKETAVSAVKKYHNRELDGQPMQVKAVTAAASTASKVAADIKALSKSARETKGPPVDPGLIHKALFKTSGGSTAPSNPVSFTVQI